MSGDYTKNTNDVRCHAVTRTTIKSSEALSLNQCPEFPDYDKLMSSSLKDILLRSRHISLALSCSSKKNDYNFMLLF